MANKEGARKSGKFIAVCTTPDVCMTPVGNTVVPIPYQITANLSDSASTSSNVNFGGDPVFILNKSKVTRVMGDEAGIAGGVKSGTNRAFVEPIEGSSNFRVNKRPVVRHGDRCKMNNGNTLGKFIYQGGGGGTGGNSDYNPPVKPETPAEKSFLDKVGGLYDKLNIKPLQELKKGIQGGIDKVVEASGYNPIVMGIGAAATAANEVFVPENLTDFTPGKLITKGKKAYSAVKGAVKTGKMPTAAAIKEEKRVFDELVRKKEAARKAQQEAAKKKGKDGTRIKGNKNVEKGKCGEWLAKMDMAKKGYDEIVSVQNNSGHGVDLIGRNSKTGEVKVWEVKTTDGTKAPGLSKEQANRGGKEYTNNRLGRAAGGRGNYGKVKGLDKIAKKAKDWIKEAGDKVKYEKREVFIDDIEKGCAKHPNRASKSKPWPEKGGNM